MNNLSSSSTSQSNRIVSFDAITSENIHTDFICTKYDNLYFIIVTQYGKIGTIVHAQSEYTSEYDTLPTYEIKTISGDMNNEIATVCARKTIELIAKKNERHELLLSLSLKTKIKQMNKDNNKILKEIMNIIDLKLLN